MNIAVATDEPSEHFGIHWRRKTFGPIVLLVNHRIPQLRIVVRILESAHRYLARIVQDCRIDGSRTNAFARRNTSIEDGKIEASRCTSRFQKQECSTEKRPNRMHCRLWFGSHFPAGRSLRRHPWTGWHTSVYGARGAGRRYQFHAWLIFTYRCLCLRIGFVGIGIQMYGKWWRSCRVFAPIRGWTQIASDTWRITR